MSDIENDSDYFDFDSDDDDDDLEMDLIALNQPRHKNEGYLDVTVPQYTDEVFFDHFRVSRRIVQDVKAQYEQSEYFKPHNGEYGKLSSTSQVLIFLWFVAHQTASFRDVGDRFNISISCLHRIIRRVTLFLSNLSPQIITWPTDDEKLVIAEHFSQNGFPRIIGAIDGCHIKIDKPKQDPESYMNRKGYYSIQMQVVCDHSRKIRDIFVGFPGSAHDSRVFANSPLSQSLEEKCGNYFLLGDSGYPLRHHLLTPFKDRGQLTLRQINYNIKLSKNRYVIEHCFGILKQKFRQMYHLKLRDISTIVHLIRAVAVLHNLALGDEFILQENVEVVNELLPPGHIEEEEEMPVDQNAEAVRNNIVDSLRM